MAIALRVDRKSGTSDMNVTGRAWNCPIVACRPGDSRQDHIPDEHLDLAEHHQAIGIHAHGRQQSRGLPALQAPLLLRHSLTRCPPPPVPP